MSTHFRGGRARPFRPPAGSPRGTRGWLNTALDYTDTGILAQPYPAGPGAQYPETSSHTPLRRDTIVVREGTQRLMASEAGSAERTLRWGLPLPVPSTSHCRARRMFDFRITRRPLAPSAYTELRTPHQPTTLRVCWHSGGMDGEGYEMTKLAWVALLALTGCLTPQGLSQGNIPCAKHEMVISNKEAWPTA